MQILLELKQNVRTPCGLYNGPFSFNDRASRRFTGSYHRNNNNNHTIVLLFYPVVFSVLDVVTIILLTNDGQLGKLFQKKYIRNIQMLWSLRAARIGQCHNILIVCLKMNFVIQNKKLNFVEKILIFVYQQSNITNTIGFHFIILYYHDPFYFYYKIRYQSLVIQVNSVRYI